MLRARAKVNAEGRVTLELASLRVPRAAAPEAVRARVTHWAQWIDAWCVDWDYRRGPMNVSSYVSRKTPSGPLHLVIGHTYAKPGKYVAMVTAFDILGGQATTTLDVSVE